MPLEAWDPLRKLNEFRRNSIRMFDELLADLPTSYEEEPIAFRPDVDLVETPDEFRFYVSIPGMVEDDLLINVDGRGLTIWGERHAPYDVLRRGVAIREWR